MSEPETELATPPEASCGGAEDQDGTTHESKSSANPEETTATTNAEEQAAHDDDDEENKKEIVSKVDQNEGENSKEADSSTEEGVINPIKHRSSLIGIVKTVTEDGDTDEEAEGNKTQEEEEDPWVIPDSNLRNPNRRICVVTTAALPWRTGTAVNPLLRALYLTRGRPKHYVTLVIPWCPDEDDRNKTLGSQYSFASQDEQEEWIRDFCRTRANCEGK